MHVFCYFLIVDLFMHIVLISYYPILMFWIHIVVKLFDELGEAFGSGKEEHCRL